MNVNRKVIEVEINDEKMEMVLDFESAIYYQENMEESIFTGIARIGQKMDVKAFAYLIASTLRNKDESIVGIDFVKKLDLVNGIDTFMGHLGQLMDNSVPKAKEDNSEKK